jgi:hypothetical protein
MTPLQGPTSNRRLLYFVTEDWYFCSHRLPLAIAAKNAGYSVYVVTRVRSHGAEIEAAGILSSKSRWSGGLQKYTKTCAPILSTMLPSNR